ncbi:hypothetical protein GCM10027344_27930 [Spelaeicoccus albus]
MEFDLGTLVRIEENLVAQFGLPHVRAGGDDFRPGKSFPHGGGGWNDDAGGRFAFALLFVERYEQPIVEHANRQGL